MHCDKCVYIEKKYSISRSDLAWLNRSATRTRWCALLNALVNATTRRAALRASTRDPRWMYIRVNAKSEFQVRVLKADVSPEDKLSSSFEWLCVSLHSQTSSRSRCLSQRNACQSCRMFGNADSESGRPPCRYPRDTREAPTYVT